MNEIETFTREAARVRGIDPDIVVRAFQTEGGVSEPARLGDFSGPPWFSGKSWYPPQLHWGGRGPLSWQDYTHFGHTAGMGNGFTALTGWEPGDPRAWRDAIRYALNRVKTGGWGPWYGPAAIGITGFMGVDRSVPWDANSEQWDFETGGGSVPKIVFDWNYPASKQDDDWSCAPTSLDWAMRSLGRTPGHGWIEQDMLRLGFVTRELGLMLHTGAGIVQWLGLTDPQHYAVDGFSATNTNPISWDALVAEANPHPSYPILLGLPNWGGSGRGHWSGVRGYDASNGTLILANPASGPTYGHDGLNREMFESRAGGNASVVRVLHSDLIVAPPPPDKCEALRATLAEIIPQVEEALRRLKERV
jgi:hypothetical protein